MKRTGMATKAIQRCQNGEGRDYQVLGLRGMAVAHRERIGRRCMQREEGEEERKQERVCEECGALRANDEAHTEGGET